VIVLAHLREFSAGNPRNGWERLTSLLVLFDLHVSVQRVRAGRWYPSRRRLGDRRYRPLAPHTCPAWALGAS